MNRNLILRVIGIVVLCEAAAMLPSFLLALYYQEPDMLVFVYSMIILAVPGGILALTPVTDHDVGYLEGFTIATCAWLITALGGSIPYLMSGATPGFIDAFFESLSGFTTTGASVIANVELLPHGILFWRSFSQFLGGMGTIVLLLALIPSLKLAAGQLYRAEFPGPSKSKVLPRIAQTARSLWIVYISITIAEVIALTIAGMPLFDAFVHAFSTVATGGFSSREAEISAYGSGLIEGIVIFFMILGAINFALHISALRGNRGIYLHDRELRFFLGLILVSFGLVAGNLFFTAHQSLAVAARTAIFTVTSAATTTGFSIVNYNEWPSFSKLILLLLILTGGCAGSTSGAIKCVRVLILFKCAARQLQKYIHPRAVIPIRLGGDVIPEALVENVQSFFFLFISIFVAATMYLTYLNLDLLSAVSAAAACLSGFGPGMGLFSPGLNYALIPASGKLLLCFCMLVGRLELYTVLVLFNPRIWR